MSIQHHNMWGLGLGLWTVAKRRFGAGGLWICRISYTNFREFPFHALYE
jgi:hypothetical protein